MGQVKPWVYQTIQDSEERAKELSRDLVDQKVRAVDTRVDFFEERVQMMLENAQPTDMNAVTKELAKFKAHLLQMLATPTAVPDVAPVNGEVLD